MANEESEILDPIRFLGLDSLSLRQKNNLRMPILADMAVFLIDNFVNMLDKKEVDDFLSKLEGVANNPVAIVRLMANYNPDFEKDKQRLLMEYRNNFKLQKFLAHL